MMGTMGTPIRYVPIDFIKTKVIGLTPNHFRNNPLLINPKSVFDGEILTKTIYSYKNLSIKIFENNNRIEFSGSLHTFYNGGIHIRTKPYQKTGTQFSNGVLRQIGF